MIALLDTHAIRWWLDGAGRLSSVARETIGSATNSMVISAVVPWELAIKANIGKINSDTLLSRWDEVLAAQGFSELPIDSSHAIRAGLLPQHHRDPFDRVLVAQAQATGWPVISVDRIFDIYGVRRIW
jgi:PIN domain nuclease of toxin-antitoxin system